MAKFFYLPPLAFLLYCCQTPDQSINKFSDPHLLRIADYQDKRLADSLYAYFNHPDPIYRRDAVQAFGSLQETGEVDRIGKLLLMDSDPLVRKAAAFALGQIKHPSCERLLLAALVKEKIADITAEVLQSYGKTTRRWQLDPAPFMDDTLKTAGLAWSLYRAGIRGKTDSVANTIAVLLLDSKHNEKTRMGAAHYFGRGASDFHSATLELITVARQDDAAYVRMAAALALGKIASDTCLFTLKEIIKNESDVRVIANAIRAFRNFPFDQIKHYLYEALNHKDPNIGITASELIIETAPKDDWIEISSLTNQASNWRIQANLYEAAMKGGNEDLAKEIQERYKKASGAYARAALLGSLKHFPNAYQFVVTELRKADSALIRTSAAGALVAMNRSTNFSPRLARPFANLYQALIREVNDPAVLGSIAMALADSTLGYRNLIDDVSFLRAAKQKLTLPEHNEALQSIEAAIARLENRKESSPVENEFNHPIDWGLVKRIPADQVATIKTARGSIIIRLLVNEAPGSVANFIALAQQDYFDDKSVHRVVPNFVIQDGCKRGDGWGSEDYSIRSEFSPRWYRTGSVGMASAGKDTEGTQWFITHSPTPHLDGRYTIFGEVLEGQAVVDFIQVGDKITDVEIENFTDQ